jgi:hypothetical protein
MNRMILAPLAWTALVGIGFFVVVPMNDPAVEYWLGEALWYTGVVWLAGLAVMWLVWVWRHRHRPWV